MFCQKSKWLQLFNGVRLELVQNTSRKLSNRAAKPRDQNGFVSSSKKKIATYIFCVEV